MTDISTLVTNTESYDHVEVVVEPGNVMHKFRSRVCEFFRGITVEIALFLALFCEALRGITQQTLLIDRVCRNELHYSDHICDNILNDSLYKSELEKVQNSCVNWNMINNLLLIFPTILMSMVIGAWSDKHGRKLPLLLPLIGGATTQALLGIYSYFESAQVLLLTLSLIPTSLFGIFIVILISLSYISDITSKHERTSRIAYLEGFSYIGYPVGTLLAGFMYKWFGFISVFSIGVCGELVAVFYVCLKIEETRGNIFMPLPTKIKDFFNCKMFVESCKTFLKKREGTRRSYIVLLLLALCCFLLYYGCESSIGYFYSQLMFNWTNFDYTLYQTLTAVLGVSINLILIPILSLCFGVSDIAMGALGALSGFVHCMVVGYAYSGPIYYLGKFLGLFSYNLPVVIRSFMSKIVGEDELGKVFAFVSMVESLCPVLSSFLYLYVYQITQDGFPSSSFFIGALVMLIATTSFLWVDLQERNRMNKGNANEKPSCSKDITEANISKEPDPITTAISL